MLLMPALDIRCGRFTNFYADEYSFMPGEFDDPLEIALWWQKQGVKMLHINDLDGFFTGNAENVECINRIKNNTSISLQVMGGIGSLDTIQRYESMGIERIVFSAHLLKENRFPYVVEQSKQSELLLGIEHKDGFLAVEGWQSPTSWTSLEAAVCCKELGINRVLINDIRREGSLKGPNRQLAREIARLGLKVTISGGVSSVTDVIDLAQLQDEGIDSVIVGKALYSNRINYSEIRDIIE